MKDLVWYILGTVLVLVAAADVFLTVLYARGGISLLSNPINKGGWLLFHRAARMFYGQKDRILSFCGPILMIFTLAVWAVLLITGFALISWPQLDVAITTSQGSADRGFWDAFFYSGYNFTTLGLGDMMPKTDLFRFLSILESAAGFTFFTMTITYFLSVYNALQKRNIFALVLHHKTYDTADAASYLAGFMQEDQAGELNRDLSFMVNAICKLLESHHLYPILHYFRFKETRHALPRILVICMDTASLSKSIIEEGLCRNIKYCATADQIWISAMDLLTTLSRFFLPKAFRDDLENDHNTDPLYWRLRFFDAVEQLGHGHMKDDPAVEAAAQAYIRLRVQWNSYIVAFCRSMVYSHDEIMPYEKRNVAPKNFMNNMKRD